MSPSPECFFKFNFKPFVLVHILSQTFETIDNMPDSRQCSITAEIHQIIDIKYFISGNCLISLKFEACMVEGLEDEVPRSPPEAETFWQMK